MTRAPILDALERQPKHKRSANGWFNCCCSAHEDDNPSLGYKVHEDGHVGLKCQAGCTAEAIVAELGYEMSALYPPRTNGAAGPARPPRQVARYDYQNADGLLAYYVVRKADKQFPTFRPDGKPIGDSPRVPYRLPELLASTRGVVIVEGEKDADRLASLGFTATTNNGGAGKWQPEISEHLRGRSVVAIADNDDAGRRHVEDVARKLHGLAAEVRTLELPELAPKGDVSDWLDAGHTVEELRAALLAAPVYVPPTIPTLAVALAGVEAFIRRYVVFGRSEGVVAVVLWIAHTYALEHAAATPYLAVTSPEKGSGKTRLLECLRLLARGRPEIFIIPTASTIYRMLEADPDAPLLLDELDAVFRDRSDKYEEVRAIINAGHRRGAKVPRTVTAGNRHEVRMFPVFGPRALAGIGKLPDTVADRSIPVRMLKKKRSERVEKFRDAGAGRESIPVARAIEAAIAAMPPRPEADVPDELPDRAADAWEPLLAIADAAGGDWPSRARAAALILHADRADDESLGLRMLADTRLVFDLKGWERVATEDLIDALKDDEEAPWVDRDKPLTDRTRRLPASVRHPFQATEDRRQERSRVPSRMVRGLMGPLSPGIASPCLKPATPLPGA
jgi:5S rRNA maturation endonuclease (ribonuclease M5)